MKQTILLLFLAFNSMTFSQETPPPPPVVIVSTPPPEKPTKQKRNGIVEFPDVHAEFNGGTEAMQKFISANVKYPNDAIEKGIHGKVYLRFVVKKNGKIEGVTVERGVHTSLDREAKRLIEIMPRWSPAKLGKRKVKTVCRLPINFTLN